MSTAASNMPVTTGNCPNDIEMGIGKDNATINIHEIALSHGHTDASVSPSTQNQPALSAEPKHDVYPKSPPLNPSDPGDWVVDNHRLNLVTELEPSPRGEPLFRISFAEMQRMHLRKAQIKLIKHAVDMRVTNQETSPDWEKDLADYISGAIMLLGPMWLMVLHKTLYTGLVTTTVCVVFLGALCSFLLDKPMDVLSATFTYAAVLVVFVGLTSN
ncbi:hypothetical protein VP1G_10993 [Cytospora mali]|uniref:DUF6594 domain-containing protein n=1 Tax=Cytospora mali TaxID=578113 RepID=A0A194V217_CYTMA|nr:hypothetical protein VP1G_10993 [Valsa mali var. pyri (nom. inval.)]